RVGHLAVVRSRRRGGGFSGGRAGARRLGASASRGGGVGEAAPATRAPPPPAPTTPRPTLGVEWPARNAAARGPRPNRPGAECAEAVGASTECWSADDQQHRPAQSRPAAAAGVVAASQLVGRPRVRRAVS